MSRSSSLRTTRRGVVELPVTTTYRAESTFSVRKHLPAFLRDIVQIRLNDLAGRYPD